MSERADAMTTHSKAPWSIAAEFGGEHGHFPIIDGDGGECATVTAWIGSYRAEAEANARLISAAPELLAALKRQQANIRRWLETGIPADEVESKSISDQIDAAISKAEGSKP